ncbi:MAG: DUF4870 domain-containing protein [Verrucomicrobiota bacterium]
MEDTTIISKDERNWGMFGHLSALFGYLAIPFANIIAPLIIWQIKKEDMPFAADQAKECLNFQISMTIYFLVSFMLIFIFIGFLLMAAIAILNLVLVIIAGLKANEGKRYEYPFTIRFVK